MKRKTELIIAIALAIIGPAAIHFLFKIHSSPLFSAEWSAGDILSYYGTIIAALIAVYGVYISLADNRAAIKEQSRIDKLPYLSVNILSKRYRMPWFTDLRVQTDIETNSPALSGENEKHYYIEEKLSSIFFVLDKGSIRAYGNLTDKQKNLIVNNGFVNENIARGVQAGVKYQTLYIPLSIENIGNGSAVDVRLILAKDDKKGKCFTLPVTLSNNEQLYAAIFAEDIKTEDIGAYSFAIVYCDMFDNAYRQEFELIIQEQDEKGAIAQFGGDTFQERTTKERIKALYDNSD